MLTSRTKRVLRSVPSTAFTRASGCSTSTLMSVSTAARANPCVPLRRSSTRTMSRRVEGLHPLANAEFFNDLGSPGGAAKLGLIEKRRPARCRVASARARRIVPRVLNAWHPTTDRRPIALCCPISLGSPDPFRAQAARHADGLCDLPSALQSIRCQPRSRRRWPPRRMRRATDNSWHARTSDVDCWLAGPATRNTRR